jgi:hypothetical protein
MDSVIRTSRKTGNKINFERAAEDATIKRWEEWEENEVAQVQARAGKQRKRDEKKELYAEYERIQKRGSHRHAPLALAQLALQQAMSTMLERGREEGRQKKEDAARLRDLKRKADEEAFVEAKRQKAEDKLLKDAMSREEREKKEAQEATTVRERNLNLVHQLAPNRVVEYERKKRESRERAELVRLSTCILTNSVKNQSQRDMMRKRRRKRTRTRVKKRIRCLHNVV